MRAYRACVQCGRLWNRSLAMMCPWCGKRPAEPVSDDEMPTWPKSGSGVRS